MAHFYDKKRKYIPVDKDKLQLYFVYNSIFLLHLPLKTAIAIFSYYTIQYRSIYFITFVEFHMDFKRCFDKCEFKMYILLYQSALQKRVVYSESSEIICIESFQKS